MQRHDADVWVAPAKELGQIHAYVADVLIPKLLTGAATRPDLPRQIAFGDTGETVEERISAGGHEGADKRLAGQVWPEILKAYSEPRRWVETER